MVYFIHDRTNRAIKIGCSWDPAGRLAALQTSNPNELVLLGSISGMKKAEQNVHELVCRHGRKLHDRSAHISGEWFHDYVLPFVTELIASPTTFLTPKPKMPARARPQDSELRECRIELACDSGETFRESFTLKAASPELALEALTAIASTRVAFLAHTVRITRLVVSGCPSRDVDLPGAVASACNPRHGLAVIINSDTHSGQLTLDDVKQYLRRWLHGVPAEFFQTISPGLSRGTDSFKTLLAQFASVLNQSGCVIVAQTILPVRPVFPHSFGPLPRGELRSKVNRKAASKRRPATTATGPKSGVVYFIEDSETAAIKVGFCLKKPEKRLADLQTGIASPLRLIGHVAGSEADEKALHRLFSMCRVQGEWFSSNVLGKVREILAGASVGDWLSQSVRSPN